MELFAKDGHLTEEILAGLLDGSLDERDNLATSEHLATCQHCLERYTALLTEDVLLQPAGGLYQPVMDELAHWQRQARKRRGQWLGVAVLLAAAAWFICVMVLPPQPGARFGPESTPRQSWLQKQAEKQGGEGLLERLWQCLGFGGAAGEDAQSGDAPAE